MVYPFLAQCRAKLAALFVVEVRIMEVHNFACVATIGHPAVVERVPNTTQCGNSVEGSFGTCPWGWYDCCQLWLTSKSHLLTIGFTYI
jgi:hypothetical protein